MRFFCSARGGENTPLDVLHVFLKLGLTPLGGAVARIARDEFVGRRKRLDAAAFAHLVALCQLPRSVEQPGRIGDRAFAGGLPPAPSAFMLPSACATALSVYGVGAQVEVVPRRWVSKDAFARVTAPPRRSRSPVRSAYLGGGHRRLAHGRLVLGRGVSALIPVGDRRAGILWGVNAAVVGLLLAALYRPVWTTDIARDVDFALAIVAFPLLSMWRAPPHG